MYDFKVEDGARDSLVVPSSWLQCLHWSRFWKLIPKLMSSYMSFAGPGSQGHLEQVEIDGPTCFTFSLSHCLHFMEMVTSRQKQNSIGGERIGITCPWCHRLKKCLTSPPQHQYIHTLISGTFECYLWGKKVSLRILRCWGSWGGKIIPAFSGKALNAITWIHTTRNG